VGLTYYIRTVRTIPVAEFEHSRTWRVQCPDAITRIDDGQYSLAVSNDGREWNTQEPLPLAAAVRAFGSESSEGAGGDLQLEPTIMDRAGKLDVRPVKR